MRKPSLVLRAVLAASLASPVLPSPERPGSGRRQDPGFQDVGVDHCRAWCDQAGRSAPHEARVGPRWVLQPIQKFDSGGSSSWHREHFTLGLPQAPPVRTLRRTVAPSG